MADPLVGIVMGSKSDLSTMEQATAVLKELKIPYEVRVISAHRTPDEAVEYAYTAGERGIEVIIAGAGGAAALPGALAAKTVVPVLGVPMHTSALNGLDSLLSMVQMPKGVPVGTLAIGNSGAANAALLAAAILGLKYQEIRAKLRQYREKQTEAVLKDSRIEEFPG